MAAQNWLVRREARPLCHTCRKRPVIGPGRQGLRSGLPLAVVLAVKKDGLVLPGSRQEGRPAHAPGRSAATAVRVAVHSMLQRRNELLAGTVTAHETAAHCSHLLDFQPVVLVDHEASTHPTKLVGGQEQRCGTLSCSSHRKRLLACPDSNTSPLLSGPRQYAPAPKNTLSAGIALNIIVLSVLRAVLLSHHRQHLNPARR